MFIVGVPPGQLPPRAVRTLRRSSPHTVISLHAETPPPPLTHLLLANPYPSLALAVALADPRIILVSDITNLTPIKPPLRPLDPDLNLLWAGRIHLSTKHVWSVPPFQRLTVAVVGELRPRNSQSAVPSSAVIMAILTAGAANVIFVRRGNAQPPEKLPSAHVAIVAPAMLASAPVNLLRTCGVLCLGPAFVLDLVLRATADPAQYLLFEDQRHLAAAEPLSPSNITKERPLLIVKRSPVASVPLKLRIAPPAVPNKPKTHNDCSVRVQLRIAQPKIAHQSIHDGINPSPSQQHQKKNPAEPQPLPHSPFPSTPPQPEPKRHCTHIQTPVTKSKTPRESVALQKPQQSSCESPVPSPLKRPLPPSSLQPSSRLFPQLPSVPKRKRLKPSPHPHVSPVSPAHANKHTIDLTKDITPHSSQETQPKRTPQDEPTAIIDLVDVRTPSPAPPVETPSNRLHNQPTPAPPDTTASTVIAPMQTDSSRSNVTRSPLTRALSPVSKRLFLLHSEEEVTSLTKPQTHTPPSAQAKPVEELSQNEPRASRRTARRCKKRPAFRGPFSMSQEEEDDLSDSSSECDSDLDVPSATTETINSISSRKSQPLSLEEACRFCLDCLGGPPSKAEVKRLISILTHGSHSDGDAERIEQLGTQRADDRRTGRDEEVRRRTGHAVKECPSRQPTNFESPVFEDDEDDPYLAPSLADDGNSYRARECSEGRLPSDLRNLAQTPSLNSLRKPLNRASSQLGTGTFEIPIPNGTIFLSDVARREFSLPEQANEVLTAPGHHIDDEACQQEVDYTYWILGAENHLGHDKVNGGSVYSQATPVNGCSRVWHALMESSVISAFGDPRSLNERQSLSLSGICIRLLHSDAPQDMHVKLTEQLLQLREAQLNSGSDSLQVVLSSTAMETVELKHKAVTSIWCGLLQSAWRSFPESRGWYFVHAALKQRTEGLFSSFTADHPAHSEWKEAENKLLFIVEVLILGSLLFFVRPDFFVDIGENDICTGAMHANNWAIIEDCTLKISSFISESVYERRAEAILVIFLRSIAIHLYDRIWPASDVVISQFSRLIEKVAGVSNNSCFCRKPSRLLSIFQTELGSDSSDDNRKSLEKWLKSPCDCMMLLTYLCTRRGESNKMKLSMGVIRAGSVITRHASSSNERGVRATNHHIGLVLTVADTLAMAMPSPLAGEGHVCRMLTSKCWSMERVARECSKGHGGLHDRVWQVTLDAVKSRCELLLSSGRGGVSVYTDWLSKSVQDALTLLQDGAARSGEGGLNRETARVTEAVVCNLAILMMSSLSSLFQTMSSRNHTNSVNGETDGTSGAQAIESIRDYAKVGESMLTHLRLNCAESVGRGRHRLLAQLMLLLYAQLRMAAGNLVQLSALSVVQEQRTWRLIRNIITRSDISGDSRCDEEVGLGAVRAAAVMVGIGGESVMHCIQGSTVIQADQVDKDVVIRDAWRLAFWDEVGTMQFKHISTTFNAAMSWAREQCALVGLVHIVCGSFHDRKEAALRLATVCAKGSDVEERVGRFDENVSAAVAAVERWLRLVVRRHGAGAVPFIRSLQQRVQQLLGLQVSNTARKQAARAPSPRETSIAKGAHACGALIIYTFLQAILYQLGGFSMRFSADSLETVRIHVQRLTSNATAAGSRAAHLALVQQRIITALGMCAPNMETRVLVLRVARSFGGHSLDGFWRDLLLPRGEVDDVWMRRAERGGKAWKQLIWEACVERDVQQGVGFHRVEAALREGSEAGRLLVEGLIRRKVGWTIWKSRADQMRYREVARSVGVELEGGSER